MADPIRHRAEEVAEWLHSVIDIHDSPPSTTSVNSDNYKIGTIPSTLLENTSKQDYFNYYEPHVVSIGPIHHGKIHLEAVEKLKRTAAGELAKRVVKDNKLSIEQVYASVEQDLLSARNCYSPSHTECYANDRDWCLMLFLDGCFIIQFIYSGSSSRSGMNMKKHVRDLVCRDLLLFENQLPFQLLHALLRAFAFTEDDLLRITERFLVHQMLTISPHPKHFGYIGYYDLTLILHQDPPAPSHLLRHFRDLWIPCNYREQEEDDDEEEKKEDRAICEPLSVTELKKMGIRCSYSYNHPYFEVIQLKSFVLSGTLFLPRLIIHEWTKTLLLNLVAFEFSRNVQDETIGVWSYLNLMNMLIKGEEDVKELRARGILQIESINGDQEVVDLLRYITAREAPNPRAYWHVKQCIFTYTKSKMFPLRVLVAELKHRYFRGPWNFLVFLAVLFTVGLNIIQTALTGIQTYK